MVEILDIEDYLDTMEEKIYQKSLLAIQTINSALSSLKNQKTRKAQNQIKKLAEWRYILKTWQHEYSTITQLPVELRVEKLRQFSSLCREE